MYDAGEELDERGLKSGGTDWELCWDELDVVIVDIGKKCTYDGAVIVVNDY